LKNSLSIFGGSAQDEGNKKAKKHKQKGGGRCQGPQGIAMGESYSRKPVKEGEGMIRNSKDMTAQDFNGKKGGRPEGRSRARRRLITRSECS